MTMGMAIQATTAVMSISGRFDFQTQGEFWRCADSALSAPDVTTLEIDLGEAEYLDSMALGLLLLLREKAQAGKQEITLRVGHGPVRQELDLLNFGRLFRIV